MEKIQTKGLPPATRTLADALNDLKRLIDNTRRDFENVAANFFSSDPDKIIASLIAQIKIIASLEADSQELMRIAGHIIDRQRESVPDDGQSQTTTAPVKKGRKKTIDLNAVPETEPELPEITIVCAGGCGKTTEGMTMDTRSGEFRQVDDSGVPLWTCQECLDKAEAEVVTQSGQPDENTAG